MSGRIGQIVKWVVGLVFGVVALGITAIVAFFLVVVAFEGMADDESGMFWAMVSFYGVLAAISWAVAATMILWALKTKPLGTGRSSSV